MRIPLLLHLGAVSEAAPLVAAAVLRRGGRGARGWVLLWCGTLVAADAAQLWMARHGVTNIWVGNVVTPIAGALVLWALSCWQTEPVARLTFRLAIVPFLAIWAALTLAFDRTSNFSLAASPMANLVCLGAAAYTLVARSRHEVGELTRQDWFWVSAGMALYFGTFSMIGPLSALFVRADAQLMTWSYEVLAVLAIAGFLAIARGVTCPSAR